MKRLMLIILVVLPATILAQINYYVSSSRGSDSNTGKSTDQAWKTLNKVNSYKPNPGDKILFKRGDEWVGTIKINNSGTSGNPITYGAYGTGERPKIYGSEVVTGWTLHSGNIYKANIVASGINQVFVDGQKQQSARYPNLGYFNITSAGTTSITSNQINGGINYRDAVACVRTREWYISTKTVSSSSDKTITLPSEPLYGIDKNEGFFLFNKLEFLDIASEWFFDDTDDILYLWIDNGGNPNNYTVRASSKNNLIEANGKSYVKVQNLELIHANEHGVDLNNCNNITIDDCYINTASNRGVEITSTSSNSITISNCKIDRSSYFGIQATGSNHLITDNKINNIGLISDIGVSGTVGQSGAGIHLQFGASGGSIIKYNRIENVGYNGIWFFDNPNTRVEYNFIKNACLTIEDGGGIYCFESTNGEDSDGSVIRYNIVDNVPGNGDGYTAETRQGDGIYTDDRISNVTVEYNTVSGASHYGIYLHNNQNVVARHNTIFNVSSGYRATPSFGAKDNIIENNIIVNIEGGYSSSLAYLNPKDKHIVKIDNNTYVDCHRANPFKRMDTYSKISFDDWKSVTGQDSNSQFKNLPLTKDETEKIFYNDTKQKKTFDFGSKIYKDIKGSSVTGSITLEPFTSIILIGTGFENIQSNNQTPSIQNQSFEVLGDIESNSFIGQIIANDPDVGQNLTFTIIDRNDEDLFSIDTDGKLTANKNISIDSNRSYDLTVQVTDDDAKQLSASAVITVILKTTIQDSGSNTLDTTAPKISSFSIPSTSTTLTVEIINLSASDDNAIAGYLVSTSSSTPEANNTGWQASAPTKYTFSQEGIQNLYAWVRDAAGNVSNASSATVNITLPELKSTSSEYLFEEESGITVVDSKGNVDGTMKNEEARVKGVNGNGIQLTGKGYVNLGKSYLARVKEEVTLSAWIKPASVGSYQGVIMHGGPNTDSFALYINSDEQSIGFKTTGTTNQWTKINTSVLWDGKWHQLTATYDGNQKIIYIDGKKIFNIEAIGTIESGEGYNCLIGKGRDNEYTDHNYSGLIDEVRIFNTALKSSEVVDLYNQIDNKITEVNQTPIILNQNFEITQTKYQNDFIGKVNASDPNSSQNVTFSITNGNEEGLFTINANSGEITANKTITPSVTKSYVLTVQVTDDSSTPLSASANVTVNLKATNNTNVNNGGGSDNSNGGNTHQNQRPAVANQSFEINDIKEINDVIGKVQATDPDQDQTLTYSILEGNEDGLFSINPSTGEIYANKTIHTTIDQTVTLLIKVKDNATNSLSATATVNIALKAIRINQRPEISSQTFYIREEVKINNIVGQIVATDPDEDQNLTYSIISGNEEGLFVIDANTGEITTNFTKSITVDQTIVLVVEVTDNDEASPLTATTNITINLFSKCILEKAEVNVDDPQRVILYFSKSLNENLIISETINDFSLSHDKSIHHISFQDSIIYLDTDTEYKYGDTITISYLKGSTSIIDVSGNVIKSFTNCPVDNNLIQTEELNTDITEKALTVKAYPNPVSNGILNIEAKNLKTDDLRIYIANTSGRIISEKVLYSTFGDLEKSINISSLSAGLYLVKFTCSNETSDHRIIVR